MQSIVARIMCDFKCFASFGKIFAFSEVYLNVHGCCGKVKEKGLTYWFISYKLGLQNINQYVTEVDDDIHNDRGRE